MTIKVLAMGQSNMVGQPSADVPSFESISANVTVWNNVNPLGSNGSAFVSVAAARAAGAFTHTDRNNLIVWFCDKLARKLFDSVTLCVVARQGCPISCWHPDETLLPMYDECVAVWAVTGQGPADVFLWHQGENDVTGGTQPAYTEAFETMLQNLTNDGIIDPETIILIGGIADENYDRQAFNLDVLQKLCIKNRRAFISSHGLETFDGVHFNSSSLTEFGARRYYAGYLFARSM